MFRNLFIFFITVFIAGNAFSQKGSQVNVLPETCLTPAEWHLYKLINEYRRQKGLPEVKLSKSLSYVARTHTIDQSENFKDGKRCNMHSWSDKGKWSSCCYTPDHKKSQCMWDKPRELTNYPGDGYEISFWSTYEYDTPEAVAEAILNGWKKSPGHNDVIVNKNIWKKVNWQAIGVGIHGEYTNVWFGKEEDKAGEPVICE